MRIAAEAGLRRRKLIHSAVQTSNVVEPVHRVTASVTPWQPAGCSDAQEDASAALEKLLGDLTARLRRPDDEHGTGWQTLRVSILTRMDLDDGLRHVLRARRQLRALERPRGDDSVRGSNVADGRVDDEATVLWVDGAYGAAGANRQPPARYILLKVCHDLIALHESIRVRAGISPVGKLDHPVGRDQRKGVPTLMTPG